MPQYGLHPPESDFHKKLAQYVKDRLELSSRHMSKFYDRWTTNERRVQAYIHLRDYEAIKREQNNKKNWTPKPVDIIVPYSYSAAHTVNTYLLHTFGGRKPIFQIASNSGLHVNKAQKLETKIDYDCAHSRFVKQLWQCGMDSIVYGCGIYRVQFKQKRGLRTFQVSEVGGLLGALAQGPERSKEEISTYEGNEIEAIDPFMFFPDPRVPMAEVNKRGEFVFWRSYTSRLQLLKDPSYQWLDELPVMPRSAGEESNNQSERNVISMGESHPGRDDSWARSSVERYVQLDEGTVDLIPVEFGLSESDRPERWLITLANGGRVIKAEPFDADHELHPVAVFEPSSFGYGFGQPGLMDFVGPLQDIMSWFFNSHIKNVNTAINNQLVVDPNMIEMQDLKMGGEGRIIRLKRAAMGQDTRSAVQQLQVMDVTRGHVGDAQMLMRLADSLVGVNENMRAIQDAGSRKTATEVRTTAESAASRLASMARLASAQALVDVSEMSALNNMQYLSQEFYLRMFGPDALDDAFMASPELIVGDFYFPIHDGTLPLDKVALLDVWRQIFMAVLQDPQLRMGFDIFKMFTWIGQLGGAQNIEQFMIQQPGQGPIDPMAQMGMMPQPDEQVAQQANAGNLVPGSAIGGINPLEQAPGRRAAMSVEP